MTIKLKKSSLFILIIVIFADHFFWLVDANIQTYFNELCWIIIAITFIIFCLKHGIGYLFVVKNFNFGPLIVFTLIMAVYSTIQSYLLHGQPLIQGLLPQRFIVGSFLSYFLIMDYLNKDENNLESLKSIFLLIGYVELFLYITQYLLIDHFAFLHVPMNSRFGEVRMNLGAIGIPFIVFNSIDYCFHNKKNQIKHFIMLILSFFYIIVIAKTRLSIVAYTLAILGGYLFWDNHSKKKYLTSLVILISLLLLTKTELFSFLIQGLNNVDLSAQTRNLGREYYISKIQEHPIFGCGYINMKNYNAMNYAGVNSIATGVIAWVDLGIFGLAFFFGIIGFFWFILLFYMLLKRAYKISKKGNLMFLMFALYMIILSPNSTGYIWYIHSTIEFVIWICLIEGNYKKYYRMS